MVEMSRKQQTSPAIQAKRGITMVICINKRGVSVEEVGMHAGFLHVRPDARGGSA
jgi:hypothetical protein